MPNRFASGRHSIAECDRCGFRYKLKDLKTLTIKTKNVNLLVCFSCWEEDHPQLQLGMYPVDDPQAVRDPRPDTSYYAPSAGGDGGSRDIYWGWNPVGYREGLTFNTLTGYSAVGSVIVDIVPVTNVAFPTAVIGQGDVSSVSISGSAVYQATNFGLSGQSGVGTAIASIPVTYTLAGESAPMNLGAVTVSIVAGAAGFYTVLEDISAVYQPIATHTAATDASGNYYSGSSFSNSVSYAGEKPTIVKYDSSGSVLWQKEYSLPYPANTNDYYSGIVTSGTDVYATVTFGNYTAPTYYAVQTFLKLSSAGTLATYSSVQFPGTSTNFYLGTPQIAYDLVTPAIFTTITYSIFGSGGPTTVATDLAAVNKYDTSGVLQWSRLIDWAGASGEIRGSSISVDSAGDLIGVVEAADTSSVDDPQAVLYKLSGAGATVWQYPFTVSDPYPFRIAPRGLAIDSSGNSYIACVSNDYSGGYSVPRGNTLIKVNSSGVVQWNVSLDAGLIAELFPVAINIDSGYVYVLYFYLDFTFTGDFMGFVLAKYDSSGTLQWQNRYYGTTVNYYPDTSANSIGMVTTATDVVISTRLDSSSTPGFVSLIKLPTDGSGLGVHGDFTYAATSFTTTSLSVVAGAHTISFTSQTPSVNSSVVTLSNSTYTNTVTPF